MTEDVHDVILARSAPPKGANRALTISLLAHAIVIALVLFVPREWLSAHQSTAKIMTITLSGTVGPKSTGINPVGGQPVQQVAPEPKRPEPEHLASQKSDAMVIPDKKPPKKDDNRKPVDTVLPPLPAPRPPTIGKQITQGSSVASTGATGMTNGLSFGGGVGGEQTLGLPPDFCCMPWAQQMVESISLYWNRNQPVKGSPVIKYTVHRDGTITDVAVEQSSGNKYLDDDAQATLKRARIPPLPPEYKQQTLTVSLKFLYGS